MIPVINPDVVTRREALAKAFQSARFFSHVLIDNFFTPEFCKQLLREFPAFQSEHALNESGQVGEKAYREDVRQLDRSYVQLDEYLQTSGFLALISKISGIPDLIYDPDYIGGGTHENIDGAQLDTHVDFNYHPITAWHRRLNLIIFLNPEWDPAYGGVFELHRDAWSLDQDDIEYVTPQFNLCVMFETNEHSWHGFNKITLPKDKLHLSRKTFALYLYTATRPVDEIAPSHATIYVPRPLPQQFKAETVLHQDDVELLSELMARRAQHIKYLYEREQEFSKTTTHLLEQREESQRIIQQLQRVIRQRLPLQGYVRQIGEAQGVWEDLWVGESLVFRFSSEYPIDIIRLNGYVPEFFPTTRRFRIEVGGVQFEREVGVDLFRWDLPVFIQPHTETAVRIYCSATWNPKGEGESSDDRNLAFQLLSIVMLQQQGLPRIGHRMASLVRSSMLSIYNIRLRSSSYRACPACGDQKGRVARIGRLAVTSTFLESTDEEFSLLRCRTCETIYQYPLPHESILSDMYKNHKQFTSSEYTGARVAENLEFVTGRLNVLLKESESGQRSKEIRLLEIGAGLAWLARALKSLPYTSYTVAQDITDETIETTPWVDTFILGKVEDVESTIAKHGPYDIISLTHVIEHLTDPLRIIRLLKNMLKKKGILFMTAPHKPKGWTATSPIQDWSDWSYNHVPGHLTYFSERGIQLFAQRANLNIIYSDFSHEDGQAFEVWFAH